ncbi:MAG: cytochrome C assembly protein [Firmicutes bacterium HGW-Firmicutes-14]|nr:MAG: cytochrome C assembly protein [Firmicutes bacterium HGW-Firmicutes-14]
MKYDYETPRKWKYHNILAWTAFLTVSAALYLIFMWVPNEKIQGPVSKIIYFHVSSAWLAFFAFFVVMVCSIAYLKTKDLKWDIISHVSAEVGVLFTTIVLVTGPIWGRASWNAWWTWDHRLTTTLILWFIYVAYLMIRSAFNEEEKKARFSAIFGIIGFIDVPIVWMSIRWWRTIHPNIVSSGGFAMDPSMVQTLLASLAAFTVLYFYLLEKGIFVQRIRSQVELLKQRITEENS